jgi:hypothetical protein
VVVAICGYRTRTHITTLRKIAAIAAIPAALRCEAAGVANSVGNMRKITTVEQATAYILSVISAVAPIEVAFLVVALEITLTVANIINGTRTPRGGQST